jgi:hypothetical protein
MIYILKFNSTSEDDTSTYKLMMKAQAMHSVLHDVAQELRRVCKHGDLQHDTGYMNAFNVMRDFFWDCCQEHGIDPFE